MDDTIRIGAMLEVPVGCLTEDYKKLLKSLTVTNPEYTRASMFARGKVSDKIPKKLFFFDTLPEERKLRLPRHINPDYYDGSIDYSGISEGRKISEGKDKNTKLRDYQEEFLDDTVMPYINNSIKNKDPYTDILIDAECGGGKTFLSLWLASIYGRKTVVVVTKKKIGNQFIETVKKLFKGWSIGWEDGKKDYDITIGTYALLSKEKYGEDYYSQFGHIILDEYHRCGADTYSSILSKATCKYRTSMTATFRRKDGLEKILKLHAGDILEMERNSDQATVYPIATGIDVNEYLFRSVNRFPINAKKLEEFTDVAVRSNSPKKHLRVELDRGMISDVTYRGDKAVKFVLTSAITKKNAEFEVKNVNVFKLGMASAPMIDTEISEYETRNDIILDIIRACYYSKRKVLFLSKRKDQLFKLAGRLRRYGIDNAVVASEKAKDYIEYCKLNNRTVEENAEYAFNESRVILGIDQIAEEGMDAPHFDTILYGHIKKDVEQSIGRILRKVEGKKKPKAFCLIDKVNMYNKAFYGKEGARNMFLDLGHEVVEETTAEEVLELIKTNKL